MQITFGNNTAGTFDFGQLPGNSLGVSSTGIAGAGTAFFPPDTGDYAFTDLGGGPGLYVATSPLDGGNFPLSADQGFSVALNDGDMLSGVVHWSLLKDHSAFPDLIGTLTVSSSTGDAEFTALFAPGSVADIDIVLALYPGPTLDAIAMVGGGQWAGISAGEIVGHPVPPIQVFEPSTIVMLGVALVLFAGMRLGWKPKHPHLRETA